MSVISNNNTNGYQFYWVDHKGDGSRLTFLIVAVCLNNGVWNGEYYLVESGLEKCETYEGADILFSQKYGVNADVFNNLLTNIAKITAALQAVFDCAWSDLLTHLQAKGIDTGFVTNKEFDLAISASFKIHPCKANVKAIGNMTSCDELKKDIVAIP